jgi:hypothetical protein
MSSIYTQKYVLPFRFLKMTVNTNAIEVRLATRNFQRRLFPSVSRKPSPCGNLNPLEVEFWNERRLRCMDWTTTRFFDPIYSHSQSTTDVVTVGTLHSCPKEKLSQQLPAAHHKETFVCYHY